MDIIELIKADHAEITQLISQLDGMAADDLRAGEAMRLAVRIAVTIKIHAKAEERVFYEAIHTASPQLRELALEAPYEHQALDMIVDKLVLHRPGAELKAILHVCTGLFEHHARETEERVMLPAAAQVLAQAERVRLGRDMIAEKARIRPQVERLVGPPARGSAEGRGLHVHAHRR